MAIPLRCTAEEGGIISKEMTPRVLFLSPPTEDYLAVTLLHGLRLELGANVVDWPRYDIAYRDYPENKRSQVYGRGFTAFFNLEPIAVDRGEIEARLQADYFDLIVISNIWHLFPFFARWHNFLNPRKTILVDGADTSQVYPYAGYWWRHPSYWFLPHAHRRFLYFKREWAPDTQFNLWHKLLPRGARKFLPQARNLRRIAFSIPDEKIVKTIPMKSKDFPRHIVDPEVAAKVPGSSTSYAFSNEAEYYADLQSSRFGITTKRSGWDCLRHYEIAANGAVPCFRNLDKKPVSCAPHGLVPGENCICYHDVEELWRMIAKLNGGQYKLLVKGALNWAQANTAKKRAKDIMNEWCSYIQCFAD